MAPSTMTEPFSFLLLIVPLVRDLKTQPKSCTKGAISISLD
ncbi:hypothetical protein LV84_03001 [Algoriphagus ratkowskyi]|uniref:Uncharacterized protein n=1 Tax=Algoriphagus ratkowskyi TaxID=57028 RepID=A0A2W7QZB9_9BACT|nr:hypothetical protein LV84_03001 [Algoriphagus ratkowskyi]